MSITLSPTKATYLARVAEGLSDLSEEEREEMLQDLEAHLAELDDEEVDQVLGAPEAFVAEFRASAGLVESPGTKKLDLVDRFRARLASTAQRLSDLVRWPRVRPGWIWVRGWLIVSAWAWAIDMEVPEFLVVPRISGSTFFGLILAIGATGLSLWLDRGAGRSLRSIGSVALSVLGGFAVLGILANPMPVQEHFEEQIYFGESLVSADGNPITNIFAYDLDGEPVQVLLFDQDGRPLRTFPPYVYEEAEFNPTQESFDTGFGTTVTFERDQYGRMIPNLYPLQLSMYSEYGELVPIPPPLLGFPSGVDEGEAGPSSGATTIVEGQ